MIKFKFETLLLEKDLKYNERWSPNTVPDYSLLIRQGALQNINEELLKNICYSMQYLEYINLQIQELKLHSIVEKMLYKTFIVITISIIEAIFYYILKSNNQNKIIKEELIFSTRANKKKLDGEEVLIETNIFKTIEPKDGEMAFDSMIKKMEKGKYLDLRHEYFPYLKHIKDLRNRIHIHITENDKFGTDFFKFDIEDFLFTKKMLLLILTDDKIQVKSYFDPVFGKLIPQEYDFLVLNDKEQSLIQRKYGIK